MGQEFIRPNLHVILIHYPLALLTLGVLIELITFLSPQGSLRTAGRWMIGIGAFLSVVAAFSGIYALSDVAHRQNPAGDSVWADVRAASPLFSHGQAWHNMRQHMIFQSSSAALAAAVAVVWIGLSDRSRRSMHLPLLLCLLFAVGITMFGAWFGGELVYRHAAGVQTTVPPPVALPAKAGLLSALPSLAEIHVIAAGCVVAVALAAIGLSFRKITSTYRVIEEVPPITPSPLPLWSNPQVKSPRTPPTPMSMARLFNPGAELALEAFAPAARFWLVATLLAVGTAGGGLLMLINDSGAWTTARHKHQSLPLVLWKQIKPEKGQGINRLLAHLAVGTLLIATPAVLGLLARHAPRQRFWLGLFTLLLLAAVTTQLWLGVLLLLDTSDGPIDQFNPPTAAATP